MSVVREVRKSARSCAAVLAASVVFASVASGHAQTAQPEPTSAPSEGVGASTSPAAPAAAPAPAPAPTAQPAAAPAPAPAPTAQPAAATATPVEAAPAAASGAETAQASASAKVTAEAAASPEQAEVEATTEPDAETDEADAEQTDEEVDNGLPWALRHRRYNTIGGSTGGLHVIDPGTGAAGSVRVQMAFDMFSGDDFLYDKDQVEQDGQSISLGWSATDFLELYGTVLNRASTITEDTQAGDQTTSLSVLGDITVGLKMFANVTPIFRVGGQLRVATLGGLGGEGSLLDATGIGLTAAAALDLTAMDDPLPIIGRLNLDYFFDNSSSLVERVEQDKYDALKAFDPDLADIDNEPTHFMNRFERFALGIGRVDVLTIGAGMEFPLALAEDIYLHPMLEWTLGLPLNRQGYDCPYFSADEDRGTASSSDDTCVNDAGFNSFPQKISVGARFTPPVRGLSAFAAMDVTITGGKEFTRELIPQPSYRLHFGLSYGYDAEPEPEPEVVATVLPAEPAEEAPAEGRLQGTVVEAGSATPIAGAQVTFVGADLSALATSADGTFVSYAFPAGAVVANVAHPDYAPGTCTGMIPAEGGDTQVRCELTAVPAFGQVEGTVRDPYGAGVSGASLELEGPTKRTIRTDDKGRFSAADLPAGEYAVLLDADGYLARTASLTVKNRQASQVELTLASAPATSSIKRAGDRLLISSLRFTGNSTELSATGERAMAELADLMLTDDSVGRVRIQAPGTPSVSLTRSLLLKQRLVDAGVDPSRVETQGGARGIVVVTVVN